MLKWGAKLESLSRILERAINSGDSSIGQLDRQISELSTRIDSAAAADENQVQERLEREAQIVEELQSIVARVDSIDPALQDTASFNSHLTALERQMADITAQLGSIGPQPDLSAIESRLGGIEEQFAANRDVSIDAANRALQHSAAIDNSDDQTASISSLAKELKNLANASSELKGHSFETFDAVRDSLAMILDRINGIELHMTSDSHSPGTSGQLVQPVQAAQENLSDTDMADAGHNSAASTANQDEAHDAAEQSVASPPLDLQNTPELDNPPDQDTAPGDDLPLEPGSGAPDMGALVRRAKKNKREKGLENSQQNPTDFIAAARRAAQAAANEAELAHSTNSKKSTSSRKNFFARKFSHKKKLALLGVLILLLAVLVVPVKKIPPLNGSNTVIEANRNGGVGPDTRSEIAANDAGEADALPALRVPNSLEPQIPASNAQPQPTNVPAAGNAQSNVNRDVAALPVETPNEAPADAGAEEAAMLPAEVGPVALRLAAAKGDPAAMFEVGRRYTDGIEGTPDFASAIKWFKLAAKANHAPAQYRLGNFSEKGHGGDRDVKKAANWYFLAAKQGNALAMHNLAVIHAMGVLEGGADLKQASLWFAKAANLGIKDSQVNLGIVYAKAMGIKADYVEAYKWFAIAANAGDKDAAQKRDTIAKQMDDAQLKQARGEVELWKPQELNQVANSVNIPVEWDSDKSFTASLASTAMVKKTQIILAKLGYNPGFADGLIGDNTTKAIRDFQKQAGIPVNGKVTLELISALDKANP